MALGRSAHWFRAHHGALHDGHLALVKQALGSADRVVVSIFVNPTQFAPGEDFDAYPRTLEQDADKLAETGAHLVYAPDAREMYPEGFVTSVSLTGPSHGMESVSRPHFFNGVATVVCKLLNQVQPDVAVFGEKDYQQLMVIRRMVTDLNLPVEIQAARPCARLTASPSPPAMSISTPPSATAPRGSM
jgi:pantoate--beta-alanine ligase